MAQWRLQWRLLTRIWRHEGGFQAAEKVAAIAVVLALLGALAVAFVGNGNTIGQTATNTIQRFISGESGQVNPGTASGTITVASLTSGAVGVPNLLLAQIGGQTGQQNKQQQRDCGFLAFNCWDDAARSAAGWVSDRAGQAWNWTTARASDAWGFITSKEGIGAILGFIGAGLAVLAAVALGVFAGLPALVVAAIVVVALALGALAGYLYVKITGRVDVWVILGLGFLVGGIGVVVGVWLAGGAPALAAAWSTLSGAVSSAFAWARTVALPALGRGLSAAWTAVRTQVARFGNWVWNIARPAIVQAIKSTAKTVWRVLTAPFRWLTKLINFRKTFQIFGKPWDWRGADLINNLLKLLLLTAAFKDVWINNKDVPWWQFGLYIIFAGLSAFAPAAGWLRVGVKLTWDFLSIFVTGGQELWNKAWPKIQGFFKDAGQWFGSLWQRVQSIWS